MKFYIVNEDVLNKMPKNGVFNSPGDGIPAEWMGLAFGKVSKDYKTVDDMGKAHMMFFEGVKPFFEEELKEYKVKKNVSLYVVPASIPVEFTVEVNGVVEKFIVIANNQGMKFSHRVTSLVKEDPREKDLTDDERKALMWLKNGHVGMSSKTMCLTLFPNLESFVEYDKPTHPYDNGDFARCIGFVDAMDGLSKEQMAKVASISDKWANLVKKWDEIALGCSSSDVEASSHSYDLIRQAIDEPNRKKKNGM